MCKTWKIVGYTLNAFVYFIQIVILACLAWNLRYKIKHKSNESFEHHNNLIKTTWLFMTLSLLMKFGLTIQLFDYETDALLFYSISELIILFSFSVFKTDEDCFKCFHRGDSETYSWF